MSGHSGLVNNRSDVLATQQRMALENYVKTRDVLEQEATLWGLEAAKHIALIALAGLGGVFSLMASDKIHKSSATIAVICFAVASFLCLLSMYLTHLSRLMAADYMQKLIERLSVGEQLSRFDDALRKKSDRLISIGNGVAWGGVAIIVGGGAVLFRALL